jgi:hypothetical protein
VGGRCYTVPCIVQFLSVIKFNRREVILAVEDIHYRDLYRNFRE